ncbi:MAG: hypothetical protein UW07_C0009G0013 [Candidatus Nomurabacteria bacterium GW2011_GWF2_43_8]|uniref:Uncharacterized protein n=3 Tax=Candidatus Nomuraibacteriota TaxID=1752729 RepID=A0A0G1INH3_9BACT|nr:MAG: hypothetical protein UV76_C0002G0129 [Candidatus Nomurabacteria bacterium GW2011_GWA2_43_15]KKT19829.1 MAG: hypothetical protein UW02_C0004G0006 [Candidatus Nomurabacteria bacterium GW2011_GWB1_43_7]KKT24729.1 MAG: hypothetical protein UW07_C0009G0013 [Candidatus Nomurabacteria bacterium GW2011_GWF2_43_8]
MLLGLVIILIAAVAFLLFKDKTPKPYEGEAPRVTEETAEPVDWENKISDIKKAIGPEFLGARIEESYPLGIFQKGDITGDGAEEALVDLGSGGAYISSLVLMRMEDGKPVVVRFKQEDGKISSMMFLAGASVMNGEDAVMLPDKKAIYAGHWERDAGSSSGALVVCTVEAYQWNSQTQTFNFNSALSGEIKTEFCQKAGRLQE